MAIYGVEGGIGSGKTLTLVYYGIKDLYNGKHIYSNIKFRCIPKEYKDRITYLTKDKLIDIFNLIKNGTFKMENSTVLIQEAHNYIDSRRSMFKDNRMLTYWILQSRHTGKGSCDIMYDTQELRQVDIRLRQNTDYIFHPRIVARDIKKKPMVIRVNIYTRIHQRSLKFTSDIDVYHVLRNYATYELVEF